MKIAVVGPGAIGSTFAYKLARAGHDVTVVARAALVSRRSRGIGSSYASTEP